MNQSLDFTLNDGPVRTSAARGTPLVDFLRGEAGLSGTKEGCREGDCGACAVLLGTRQVPSTRTVPGTRQALGVRYRAVPSCLFALGEAQGCHIITIEGLVSGAPDGLTPVMRAFLQENASQCGFCSPGFIISLSAWLAQPGSAPDMAGAMAAIDGNLCRCTGYGAIRRAAARLCREFADLPADADARMQALVDAGVLPRSVLAFAAAPAAGGTADSAAAPSADSTAAGTIVLGGGTDYYVRNPDPEPSFAPTLLARKSGFAGITGPQGGKDLVIGGATRVADFFASAEVRAAVPGIERFEGQFASTLIRNLATLGGNLANASPVGDLTAMLMALGATLELEDAANPADSVPTAPSTRTVPIERFFIAYKKTALAEGQAIRAIRMPAGPRLFSFEKASKRATLDIAAVNSGLSFRLEGGVITDARLSAGGVAPVPLLLPKASALLEGAHADAGSAALAALARAVAATAEGEISPISDVRGSAEYRRRMTGRFVLAHFLRLFPDRGLAEELFP